MSSARQKPTRVTVDLRGGVLDGLQADAPRDSAGRVLNDLWVGTGQFTRPVVAREAEVLASQEGPPALYRLDNWRGQNPIYRYVVATDDAYDLSAVA